MKDRFIRSRLPDDEYRLVKIAADRLGLTLSEHIRCVLVRDRQALSQEQFLAKIDSKLSALSPSLATGNGAVGIDRLLFEVLLLVREIAAERNAQILGRVAAQVTNRFLEGK
jgi:hypothetical protein